MISDEKKRLKRLENRRKYPEIAKVYDQLKRAGLDPKVISVKRLKDVNG